MNTNSFMIVNGKNIVIGVGDTGLDVQSTFFYDAQHSVRYNTKKLDPNHRKVALYVPFANKQESVTAGHGTHVCGTIAGNSNNDLNSLYNVFLHISSYHEIGFSL